MVTLDLAKVIAKFYYGSPVKISTGTVSYSAKCGVHRLQIIKDLFSARLVMCRIFVMDQSIGYFYFDLMTHQVSRIYADD